MAMRITAKPLVVTTQSPKLHAHLAGLASALKLKVGQPATEQKLSIGRRARPAQNFQRQ